VAPTTTATSTSTSTSTSIRPAVTTTTRPKTTTTQPRPAVTTTTTPSAELPSTGSNTGPLVAIGAALGLSAVSAGLLRKRALNRS
jgi:LPXTG-motif cell wall-anchored protein